MADSRPDSESTPPKPRGLWSLMGAAPESAEQPTAPDQEASVALPPSEPEPLSTDTASSKQRGLWGMMGQAPTEVAPPTTDPQTDPKEKQVQVKVVSVRSIEAEPTKRGLFAMMQRADEIDQHADPMAHPALDEDSDISNHGDEEDEEQEDAPEVELVEVLDAVDDDEVVPSVPDEQLEVAPERSIIDLDRLEHPRYRLAEQQTQKQVRISLIGGIAAIFVSPLSFSSNILAGLPATVLGFAAIIAGALAVTGPQRRKLSRQARVCSIVGMLCGTIGIFLGPTLINGIARSLREPKGDELTRLHLEKFAEGLDLHYQQHDTYPVGGTFTRNEAGAIQGQHGWMTFLLPFVGEGELYKRINLDKPFEDPVNRNAMGTNVPLFFAAGGGHARNGDGFAIAHYAGVGGEINESNRVAHLGIFERDAAVKRNEVTDGLANTLIIGELAGRYPPWGDPENWREIGQGLNKDPNGFGSTSGKGSMFLLGDGSVKFFPNKTDIKLLEKMGTRDGAEK